MEDNTSRSLTAIANEIQDPPDKIDEKLLDRIQGSIFGTALGDALGAHVEFRPRQYMRQYPVKELQGGGTWGLATGQVLTPIINHI